MKYMISYFLLFVFINVSSQINYEVILDVAFQKAFKENKIVLIKYYSETCSHCKELQKVLENDSLSKFLNENFVFYKIETETSPQSDFNFLMKNKVFIESVPCLLFFDNSRKFIHYGFPKQDVESVLKTLKTALDPIERTSNLAVKYQSGDRDKSTLKRYSKLAQIQKDTAIINLLATLIFYLGNRKGTYFVRWHCTQALLSQLSLLFMNSFGFWWTIEEFESVKKYIKITKLSENVNGFFWEEETKLLFDKGFETKALTLLNEMLEFEKENSYQMIYLFKIYLSKLKQKQSLVDLKKSMDLFFPYIKEESLKENKKMLYETVENRLKN